MLGSLRLVGWIGVFTVVFGIVLAGRVMRRLGMLARLQTLMLGTLCVLLGSLCVGLWLALHAFETFSRETLVAHVSCNRLKDQEFDVTMRRMLHGQEGPPEHFVLRGDQWEASGGIVKWHPWLTALGLPSYYKLMRLTGRYVRTADERAHPPTAYDLNGETDWAWWLLYRLDPILPFVEAAYGSAAFVKLDPSMPADLYVTPSGFLVKRRPVPGRRSRQPAAEDVRAAF